MNIIEGILCGLMIVMMSLVLIIYIIAKYNLMDIVKNKKDKK